MVLSTPPHLGNGMSFELIAVAAAKIFETKYAFSGFWCIWPYAFLSLLYLLISSASIKRENAP